MRWFLIFIASADCRGGCGRTDRRRDKRRKTTTRATNCSAPDTAQFRIYYEVTATTAGARFFYNAIRPGSVATDERVVDLATGQALKWEVVSGKEAREAGHPTADLDTEYIKVHLLAPGSRRRRSSAARSTRRTRTPRAITGRATPSSSIARWAFGGTPSCCPRAIVSSAATFRHK